MILERIIIKNLFNKDYDIKFQDISFLYGENGCGKTIVMYILHSIISGDISSIKEFNIEEITLEIVTNRIYPIKESITITNKDIEDNMDALKKYRLDKTVSSIFIPEVYDNERVKYVNTAIVNAFNESKSSSAKAVSVIDMANDMFKSIGIFIYGTINNDVCISDFKNIFTLKYAGGGVKQVLFLLTKIFLDKSLNDESIIFIDNPEIHLHLMIQNRIINMIKDYTNAQLIIATHSPEIISRYRDNMVQIRGIERKK